MYFLKIEKWAVLELNVFKVIERRPNMIRIVICKNLRRIVVRAVLARLVRVVFQLVQLQNVRKFGVEHVRFQ